MTFFIWFVLAFALCIVIGMLVAVRNFDNNVKRMFDQPQPAGRTFHLDQVAGLPLPVKNYFQFALTDGQPYIDYARLRHHGRFKTSADANWATIEGKEYFTAQVPGFVWKGSIKNVTAVDSYITGVGNLSVYALGFVKIASGSGPKFAQGELLRWLGEAVWFPTALLPSENLQWEPIDEKHARLKYRYRDIAVNYVVTFGEAFEIVQLETKRYLDGKRLETWIGKISNYKPVNHMRIPMTMQAVWQTAEKTFTYAVFYLTDIEYDRPKIYR